MVGRLRWNAWTTSSFWRNDSVISWRCSRILFPFGLNHSVTRCCGPFHFLISSFLLTKFWYILFENRMLVYKNDTRSFDFFDMKSLLFSFQIQYWLYKMAENGTSKLIAFAILKIVSDWIFTKFEWKALHVKRIKQPRVERLLTFLRRKIFLTHCTV